MSDEDEDAMACRRVTVKHVHVTLHKALKDAVRRRRLCLSTRLTQLILQRRQGLMFMR